MQHIGIPSFYFNFTPQSVVRASTYARVGSNLSKVIVRPPKVASYRLMLPVEGEQLESEKRLFNNVKALKRDFYLTGGKSPKKLSEMYKWAVVEGFELLIQDDELRPFMPVEVLHNVSVELRSSENTPTVVYFHPAREDLGSCAHFLMDLASQLHSDIVAFEYPSFKQKDREQKLSRVNESMLLEFAKLAFNFAKLKTENEVLLFASGEGAIPCTMLARDQQDRILGIIYEEPLLEYETWKGLAKGKEERFIDMIKELDATNIFVFHGLSGSKIPISNAKTLIHNAFQSDESSKKHQLLSDSRVIRSLSRNPSPTGSIERVVEHYFVDCENYKIREIKRAKLFDILKNFIEEITQRQKKMSVMLSLPQHDRKKKRNNLSIPQVILRAEENDSIIQRSSILFATSTLFRNHSSRNSQLAIRRDDSECETTGEWRGEKEEDKSERSSSQQSVTLKRRSIQPRYKIGRHYQLKKKFQQRKETETSTLEGEDENDEESAPLAEISLIDPRARYNSMKQGSSLETPFPLSESPERSNNDPYQGVK